MFERVFFDLYLGDCILVGGVNEVAKSAPVLDRIACLVLHRRFVRLSEITIMVFGCVFSWQDAHMALDS